MTTNNAINSLSGGTIPGINRVVNGDFQVWQRGAGGSASINYTANPLGSYTADRWQVVADQDLIVSQLPGFYNGTYKCKVNRIEGFGTVGAITICNSLPSNACAGMAGNYVSGTFDISCGVDFPALNEIEVTVYAANTFPEEVSLINGGSGSSIIFGQFLIPTTDVTTYTFTTSLIPTDTTQIAIEFRYVPTITPAPADDSFMIENVQLELSQFSTPFQRKTFTQTLSECRYFYQKSFPYEIVPASNTATLKGLGYLAAQPSTGVNQSATCNFFAPVRLSSHLNFTFYNPADTGDQFRNLPNGTNCTDTQAYMVGDSVFGLRCNGSATTSIGDLLSVHWTYECELETAI